MGSPSKVDGESVFESQFDRSRAFSKKTVGSVQKAKFLELIDFSKNLIGDLREQEDMKESYGTRFYNPNQASPVAKHNNENDEGEVVALGKRHEDLDQTM